MNNPGRGRNIGSSKKKVLLLNSAQGKYPRGADSWVQATVRALESLKGKALRLTASVGLHNWALTAYLGGRLGLDLDLIVPFGQDSRGRECFARTLSALALERRKTRPVFTGCTDGRDFYGVRDRLALETAEVVYPVSLRPGGRLEKLLGELAQGKKEIREEFRVKWSGRPWTPRYCLPLDRLNPALERLGRGLLIHWTHSWPGPWPGEEPWEFYREMLAGGEDYVRDARATLLEIIAGGRLRGSSWKMPAGEPAVSFTALSPAEAVGLMRWRRRYTRYTFEPYGLAFSRESLERLGAAAVRYLGPGERAGPGEDRLFTQSTGRKGNWEAEKEWRFRGDLDLGGFKPGELVLIVPDEEQAGRFRTGTGFPGEVVPLFL
ncbi:MAG: hypothetical protein JXQ83_02825 [Candidatus Glassbacteria bacterium]|nr:hypothetical protein [Candidatus Glassbacteria bacterium]